LSGDVKFSGSPADIFTACAHRRADHNSRKQIRAARQWCHQPAWIEPMNQLLANQSPVPVRA